MSETELLRQLDEEADAEYELESEEGSLFTGSALLVGCVTMAFAAITFSYFYLRELNGSRPSWRPHGLRPPMLLGDLIGLCVVAGAAVLTYGFYRLQRGSTFEWSLGAWLCTCCGWIATGLQIWQLTRLGFAPGLSGYTSVFVGFALLNCAFLFGGAYWSETVAARGLRLRTRVEPGTFLGASDAPDVRVWRGSVRGCVMFWWFMVIASTFFWVIFYVL